MQRNNNHGFIAITSIMLIAAVVLAISITVSLLAIGEGQASLALYQGETTLSFVEGCVEDGLNKARLSSSYNGGNITRPEGICTISISKIGNDWTMTTSTTETKYVRTIQTIFTRATTDITLSSWKEL